MHMASKHTICKYKVTGTKPRINVTNCTLAKPKTSNTTGVEKSYVQSLPRKSFYVHFVTCDSIINTIHKYKYCNPRYFRYRFNVGILEISLNLIPT